MSCPGCRRDRVHLASAEREKGSRSEVRLDRCFGTFVPKGMQSCVLSGLPQGDVLRTVAGSLLVEHVAPAAFELTALHS